MRWDAALYDDKHAFVYRYGEDLIKLLQPESGQHILDLGSGTGGLTHLIAETGAKVVGVDSSITMVDQASARFPLIPFFVMSATDLQFDELFDAVFSNATLHWIREKEKVIRCVYESLKPDGKFVAEMGGQGNVERIIRSVRKELKESGNTENAAREPWYFPSVAEYAGLLEEAGFRVLYMTHFDRDTPLADEGNGIVDWLEMFGELFFEGISEENKKLLLFRIQESLRATNFREGKWYADYKRLRFVAVKQ